MEKLLNKKYFIGIIFSFIILFSSLFSSVTTAKAYVFDGDFESIDSSKIQSYMVTLDNTDMYNFFTIRSLSNNYLLNGPNYIIMEYETIEADFVFADISNFITSHEGGEIVFNKISGANAFNFFKVGQRNRFTFRRDLNTFYSEKASNKNGEFKYDRFLKDKTFEEDIISFINIGIRFTIPEATSNYKIVLLLKCFDSNGNDLGVICDSGNIVKYDWKDYESSSDLNEDLNEDLDNEQNNLEVKKKFDFLRFIKILLSIVLPVSLVVLFFSFVKKKKKYKR